MEMTWKKRLHGTTPERNDVECLSRQCPMVVRYLAQAPWGSAGAATTYQRDTRMEIRIANRKQIPNLTLSCPESALRDTKAASEILGICLLL